MSQSEIRVNGQLAEGSITVKVRGKEYTGFTEITYGDGLGAEQPRKAPKSPGRDQG